MAETKARASSRRGTTSKRKATKATRKRTSAAARKPAKNRQPRKSVANSSKAASKNGAATAESARKAIGGTAKQAGHSIGEAGRGVGHAARKARTPLLAGGAALVGAAGGVALGARQAKRSKTLVPRKPRIKVDSKDLARTAKEVGEFGVQVGQLAAELRHNREQANGIKHRSPIEVVLQGLTSRDKKG